MTSTSILSQCAEVLEMSASTNKLISATQVNHHAKPDVLTFLNGTVLQRRAVLALNAKPHFFPMNGLVEWFQHIVIVFVYLL